MRAFWRDVAVAIVAASVSAATAPAGKNPQAARAFLRELVSPAPLPAETARRVQRLLADLGSDSWRTRQGASRALREIGPRAEPIVAAATSASGEVAARARAILETYRAAQAGRPGRLVEAVALLADRKDKGLLDALVALLDHRDAAVRHVSEYGLRRLTGENFGFSAHAPRPARRAAARRWAAWWQTHRRRFDFAPPANRLRGAAVLCWSRIEKKVCLFALDGKLLWSRDLPKPPYSADILANGHLVLSYCTTSEPPAQEIDRQGKVVWRVEVPALRGTLRDVTRLPSGNTLGIDTKARRVIEIDAIGRRIVWQHAVPGGFLNAAQRLANGNTLLCTSTGQILEVTRAGKTVWSQTRPRHVRDAQKLPNGNVLLVDLAAGRTAEIARDGKEVWSWSGLRPGAVVGARRLPDGRTVVQDRSAGLLAIDPTGRNAVPFAAAPRLICYREFRLAPAGAK